MKIDLRFLEAPKPCGYNYENVYQNTEEWQRLRNYKVTGSRLPALLGLYGGTKYNNTWDIVKNGISEPSQIHIRNIARGHYYEDEALSYFQLNAKCKVEKCGFFHHPQNCKYGRSKDKGRKELGTTQLHWKMSAIFCSMSTTNSITILSIHHLITVIAIKASRIQDISFSPVLFMSLKE